MPLNCLPETTTEPALEAKREAARGKSFVDWAAWGGAVADNQEHLLPLAVAGVRGYKSFLINPGIDGFTMISEGELRRALPHIREANLPLLVHAELAGPIDVVAPSLAGADWRRYTTYLCSRPDEAELAAIHLLVRLCEEFGVHIHIVHLATGQAVELLRHARSKGLPITVETCPHYLYFSAENIPDGATDYKCAPPIRNSENREMLWQALLDGVIDLVATDHSPCPPQMKRREEGNFQTAWGGIASLELSLRAMWTEMHRRGIALENIARWMSSAPAALAGLDSSKGRRKGKIAPGYDADFVVFDPNAESLVVADKLYQRHPVTPYLGEQLRGEVKATWLRGELIYEDGCIASTPKGKELRL